MTKPKPAPAPAVPPPRPASLLQVLSTEDEANQVYDPIRIQFIIGCVVTLLAMFTFIGLAIVKADTFNPSSFGTGFAALLAGLGTYIGGTGAALFMNAKAPET
jgi:hypothetical protein